MFLLPNTAKLISQLFTYYTSIINDPFAVVGVITNNKKIR